MPKSFKILTLSETIGTWTLKHQPGQKLLYGCRTFVVYSWCRRRKRFRERETLAVAAPIDMVWWWRLSKNYIDDFGRELAAQNKLYWIDKFDPQWKMQDVVL